MSRKKIIISKIIYMKILLVTMEFPPFRGGVGNYYYNLIKNLGGVETVALVSQETSNNKSASAEATADGPADMQETNKFQIINSKFQSPIIPDSIGEGTKSKIQSSSRQVQGGAKFRVIYSSFFYRYFWPKWLKLFFEVRKIIKKEKFDLIWCGQVLPVGAVCYLINKFFKIPYFVSNHGMDIMLPQKSSRKKKLMMKVLQSAKFITANSQYTKNQLLKLGINDRKIQVIYPCSNIAGEFIALEGKAAQIRQKLGLKGSKILLSVGRLVKRKGYDKVIEALAQLSAQYPNLAYLIVGQGPEKENFQFSIFNFQLKDKVKIFDDVSDEDLPYYYQLADIFMMPARDIQGDVEGFGLVYLEAANFKLPVIAGRSGGAAEAVIDNETGIMVDPESVEEIKEAIIKLLNDEQLRNQLGENGYLRSQKEFNWARQADKLEDLILSISHG